MKPMNVHEAINNLKMVARPDVDARWFEVIYEHIADLEKYVERLIEAYQSAHDRAEALAAELRAVKQGRVWHEEFNREYDIAPWNFDDEKGD